MNENIRNLLDSFNAIGINDAMVAAEAVNLLSKDTPLYKVLFNYDTRNEAAVHQSNPALPKVSGEILKTMGVPTNLLGYRYLKTAVELVINDPSMVNYMTKGLYPTIAKSHNTSPSRVERAIRHAIETAYCRGNMDMIKQIIPYNPTTKNKATNAEFIASIGDFITSQN